MPTPRRAAVIGAGPNGLAAAIVLAQAGLQVDVFEAEAQPGGAARTMELTLRGFHHDFGSAVHAMAAGSPFFSSLPLRDYGLEWIYSPAPLAHPLDDGTAVLLERDLGAAEIAWGEDGKQWRRLVGPFAEHWVELAPEILRPVHLFTRHPFLMAHLGVVGFPSAVALAGYWFRSPRTKALFAGLAAHSILALDEPLSASFGVILGATAHAVGWPIARGGSQSITNALCAYLAGLGGRLHLSTRIENLSSLGKYDVTLCDVTPRQLLTIAGDRLSPAYRRQIGKYAYGPGVFKVDYALSSPVPWTASECLRAATVHVGGTLEELAASEDAMAHGHHADRPFVLLAQPSLFDPTRVPQGKHTVWAYCHVPNGSQFDMLERLEAQIERFAPGFRDCVLARRVLSPASLESMDANLIGGDVGGGAMNMRQFLFRPTRHQYATSAKDIYLLLLFDPTGRRGAWHVWLQRRQIGVVSTVTDAPELGAGGKVATALSLTVIGGFVDAVGYIALFEIFTANMSGNSVHVGMYLGNWDFSELARPACAILAFLTGSTLTRIAMTVAGRKSMRRIASYTLTFEALLLMAFARATPAMKLGQIVDLHSAAYFFLVALLAFAMGVQTATLTHVGALTVYTTFVTGTLTKISESLTRSLFWTYDQAAQSGRPVSHIVRLATKQKDVRETAFLVATWACYVVGAAIGTFSKRQWELRSLYIPVAVLIVFIALDQLRPIGVQEEKHQQG